MASFKHKPKQAIALKIVLFFESRLYRYKKSLLTES